MEFVTAFFQERLTADALVVPFWQKGELVQEAHATFELASFLNPVLTAGDFRAKEGETLLLYPPNLPEKRVILLGLGKASEQKEDADSCKDALRRAYGALAKMCRSKKIQSVNLLFPQEIPGRLDHKGCLGSVVEGLLLANYSFDRLKADSLKEEPSSLLEKVCLIGVDKEGLALCQKLQVIHEAVTLVRDLVNRNADDTDPQTLVAVAQGLAKLPGVKVEHLDKAALEKEKMGLLLAVARGASRDPALVLIEYRGNPSSQDLTALVGKGITYDTGGLNIKQTGFMETMKCDMAGAAAVLGTLQAAATLRLPVNIVGVIPATENAIGPSSYKPGDVYFSHAGKSVEISNTDAEGRLILADALSYVQKKKDPKRIIDLATLTGAIIVALGEEATGLFCNDDTLAEQLRQAGEKTHERVWRFPLYPEYKEMLKSPIADLKNSGGKKASSITAAVFLQQFIQKERAWAHLDIAGTAFLSDPKGYHPTHATGVGVRLLIEFLESLPA